ncbi:ThuA domain-containing protein [Streptomyces sp. NRRL WC-3742]|uniref:ThuA domain-containing protein n=1 Tax=Streptomyces sp. NRRL WC-3742 TaxID=1463934 RepID=UPI00068B45F6|nr:ThuA domain-containing protein [Streptomyces sp. NRRL WC-3742]
MLPLGRLLPALGLGLALTLTVPAASSAADAAPPTFKVLVFSKTSGWRHDSIPTAVQTLKDLGAANGFTVDATEDDTVFTPANLANYQAVVFALTTGDVLNTTEKAAFEGYIRAGGGYAGIHSASDTEYQWPFYGQVVGAYFKSHPEEQQATVVVEDRTNPSTAHLPATWSRWDEWYNFRTNPRGSVHVLASVDESTYDPGDRMGDHPITWCQNVQGGRSWYTGMGHTVESYKDPAFRAMLLGGIRLAAGAVQADCSPPGPVGPVGAGTFTVTNAASGKAVDALSAPVEDGAAVVQNPSNGSASQRWRLSDAGNGAFTLTAAGGRCLDVPGDSTTADGALLQQWTCWGGPNQSWRVEPSGSGVYRLVSVAGGKCLDVPGATTADGIQLNQYTCNGTPAQQWKLTRVD